jgi:hypothetical protein
MTPREYDALHPADRPAVFTISGVESLEAIEAVRQELLTSFRACASFETFYQRSLVHLTRANGAPPSRGRLARLFWDELALSHAADRAAQLLKFRDVMPWWEYRSPRYNTRKCSHETLQGFTARWDDPVWVRIYPPTEPRCHCLIVALPEKKVRRAAAGNERGAAGNGKPSRGSHSILPFILGARPFPNRPT